MSRPQILFYATLAGGVLTPLSEGKDGMQFRVDADDMLLSPLSIFLDKAEAAQWAKVLGDFASAP